MTLPILIQSLKLVRYSRAVRRFHKALMISWEELVLFLCVSLMLIFFAAVGVYYFENASQPSEDFASVFHSLWWTVVTLTTVGYGDVVPITLGGKMFTFFVLFVGVGIITVPAGLVATALFKARTIEEKEFQTNKKNKS